MRQWLVRVESPSTGRVQVFNIAHKPWCQTALEIYKHGQLVAYQDHAGGWVSQTEGGWRKTPKEDVVRFERLPLLVPNRD